MIDVLFKKIYKEYKIKLKYIFDLFFIWILYKIVMFRIDYFLEICKDEDGEVVCVNYSDFVCVGVWVYEWRSVVLGVGLEYVKI